MQAIALVTGDKFLIPYNLTIDTGDVLDYMKALLLEWFSKKFLRMADFDDNYGIDIAEIIGPSGFCYSFNIVDPEVILNLNL
jgi:hypothetical protein